MKDVFGLVGTTIADKVRVERVIGEGGFGVVYGGTHVMLGVPVAIKCLKPTAETRAERERAAASFLREARILFALGHPSIVRLYDVGITPDGQVPYVVLELLAGVTLSTEIARRRSERRPFTRDELIAIVVPMLEAVAFAHERGVIHRDLKPGNVMLVADQTRLSPKVLDFGTARGDVVGSQPGPTIPEATRAGFTPLYAAPEQWDASFGPSGPATDVFALGIVIAELVLLAYPFAGDATSIMGIFRAITDETSRPVLRVARPDLPVELAQVVAKALRVRPVDRYPDARELAAAFRGAMKAVPVTSPLARPVERSGPSLPPAPAPAPVVPTAPPAVPAGGLALRPASSSPLPWIVGALGVVVGLGALGIAAALIVAPQAASAIASSTGLPSSSPPRSSSPSSPLSSPSSSARPAKLADASPRKVSLVFAHVNGSAPFWTAVEVSTAAAAHQLDMTACAEKAVALDPATSGEITLIVHPNKTGAVESVQCSVDEGDDLAEAALCSCIERTLGKWKLPPAHGTVGHLEAAPFIVSYRLASKPRP